MTYDYLFLGFFLLAFVSSIYQLRREVRKVGWSKVKTYSIFLLPLFLWLSTLRLSLLLDWKPPLIHDLIFLVVYLGLGTLSIIRLSKSLKAKEKFKAYRTELFIILFSAVAVWGLLPL